MPRSAPGSRRELAELGPGLLHRAARATIDPETAASVDAQNGRRIVRALEVIELTGEPKAARLPDEPVPWRPHRIVHLRADRATLVERLDARVARHVGGGLARRGARRSSRRARARRDRPRAIGYAQALAELHGRMTRGRGHRGRPQQLTRTLRAAAGRLVPPVPRMPSLVDADDRAPRVRRRASPVQATLD